MITLQPEDRLIERHFTHPSYVWLDHRQLRYMLTRLSQVLETIHWPANPNVIRTLTQELVEPDGRHHRVISINPDLLRTGSHFTIVGFFAERRPDADQETLASRDKLLYDEMACRSGLLSYSSLELTNGDYGNCIVFADELAKQRWNKSEVHAHAVREISPASYYTVRLYNGHLPASIMEAYKLTLTSVKYFDYRQEPMWRAVRQL